MNVHTHLLPHEKHYELHENLFGNPSDTFENKCGNHSCRIKHTPLNLRQETATTRMVGRKGKDHIDGVPAEDAQCRLLWVWIRTARAFYIQANKKQERFSTYRIPVPLTFDKIIITVN